jgi:hypothetical protein
MADSLDMHDFQDVKQQRLALCYAGQYDVGAPYKRLDDRPLKRAE